MNNRSLSTCEGHFSYVCEETHLSGAQKDEVGCRYVRVFCVCVWVYVCVLCIYVGVYICVYVFCYVYMYFECLVYWMFLNECHHNSLLQTDLYLCQNSSGVIVRL